jgi:peptide subunit release factor 1 (eRF1)
VKAGAEAQASFHRRSVNVWSENTEQAADDVREAAAGVEAAVVLVAGDPKAIGLLREHLTDQPPVGEPVYVDGGRSDTSALAGLRASVDAAMREAMTARHRGVLDTLEAEPAGGRALQGIPAVKEALAQGRVETLLLAADRSGDPVLHASRRDPQVLAPTRRRWATTRRCSARPRRRCCCARPLWAVPPSPRSCRLPVRRTV